MILACMMNGKEILPKIAYPARMKDCEVIYEFPDDISPVVVEDCVNNEHEDGIRNDLIEENDAKVHDELNINRDWKLRFNTQRYY